MKWKTFTAAALIATGIALSTIHPPARVQSAGSTSTSSGPRKPHAPPLPGEIRTMAIKELGNFDYSAEAGDHIPADVLQLDGMKVRLTGYMIPLDEAQDVHNFALVPSLFSCCFGQPPGIQHTILVDSQNPVRSMSDPVMIEGTLNVKESKQDGYVVSLFHVTCTKAAPAPAENAH